MKKICLLIAFIIGVVVVNAQNVGIGTTTPAGKLHIKGAASVSQLIIDANINQLNTNPLIKLRKSDGSDLMWIHTNDSLNVFIGVQSGRLNEDGLGGTYNTFIGSHAGYSNLSGYFNTANGAYSLYSNGGGYANTAIGAYALFKNNNGINNTAVGINSLYLNTSGSNNTGNGAITLYSNTLGSNNTASGNLALYANTTASQNTAIGSFALTTQSFSNNSIEWPSANTAIGFQALYQNQPTAVANGISNTAVGHSALRANTTGWDNTGIGTTALYSNVDGYENTATGRQALFYNTEGVRNTAAGYKALRSNGTGGANTADGYQALFSNSSGVLNTAIGANTLYTNTIGSFNTALGSGADVSANNLENTTAVGSAAVVNASNKMQLGSTITGVISTSGGYTIASDGRFKENLRSDVMGLDFIMKLRPYTYNFSYSRYDEFIRPGAVVSATQPGTEKEISIHQEQRAEERSKYKQQLEARDVKRETGFVAQDVEKAVMESGYTAFNGVYAPTNPKDNYSLDYSKMVVPLVKAVQEQQQQIEILQQQNELLFKEIQILKGKMK